MAEQDGKVLLVKRLYVPRQGDWALPAGFVEIDEGPVQAALRELTEETGLIGRIRGIVGTFHIRSDPRGPIVTILYHAQIVGGELKAGDDAAEVRLFRPMTCPRTWPSPQHAKRCIAGCDQKSRTSNRSPGFRPTPVRLSYACTVRPARTRVIMKIASALKIALNNHTVV